MNDGHANKDELEAELLALRARTAALAAEKAALAARLDVLLREQRRREAADRAAAAELQRRLDQLHGIYQLNEATSRAEDLEAIYAEALRCLVQTLGAHRAAVLLFDGEGRMRFRAQVGLSDGYRQAADGHSPWTPDARDPAPVLVPDVDGEPTLAALRGQIRGEGIRALGFVPLVNHGRLLGKLMIYYDQVHPFTEEEVHLAQTIAAHIAIAIDRRQREEALTAPGSGSAPSFPPAPSSSSPPTPPGP